MVGATSSTETGRSLPASPAASPPPKTSGTCTRPGAMRSSAWPNAPSSNSSCAWSAVRQMSESVQQPEVGQEVDEHADVGVHVGDGAVVELVVLLRARPERAAAGKVRCTMVQQVLLDRRERAERRPGHGDALVDVHHVQPEEAVARVGVAQQAVERAADEVGGRVGVEPHAPAKLLRQSHAAVARDLDQHLVDVRMALAVLREGPGLLLGQRARGGGTCGRGRLPCPASCGTMKSQNSSNPRA